MKQRPRIYYSASQKALIWDRWRKGGTLHQIAGLFDRYQSSTRRMSGGARPPERRPSKSALTLIERGEISRGVAAGNSIRSIAAALGRAPLTVSREIRRNGHSDGYRAGRADQAA
jgi:DNA-binding CsgD family transcriptional regulator